MKKLKVSSLKQLLAVITIAIFLMFLTRDIQASQRKKNTGWKNPLPTMLDQMNRKIDELINELNKESPDFLLYGADNLSPQTLDGLIQKLDEATKKLNPKTDQDLILSLENKKKKLSKLAEWILEYAKYKDFYQEGEEYIKKLEELGWIIHYNDTSVFLEVLSKFNALPYRAEIDKMFSVDLYRVGFLFGGELDVTNCLVTGIIKYNFKTAKKVKKMKEDMIGFYFRGYINDPFPIEESDVIEIRWLDEKKQKNIIWHYMMPYPLPLPVAVRNSLY